jgi:hypothetical protein
MRLRPVVIDFESLYGKVAPPPNCPHLDDNFSISVMGTEKYIRDPRFKAHGAAVKWSGATSAVWYDEKELRYQLAQEDWSDVFLIHHHAQFDGAILNWHYGIKPAMFGCTLAMFRLLLGNHLSVSLDSVRKHFNMPAKTTPYGLFKDKRWEEMTPQVQQLVAEGACDEVESIWKLFGIAMKMGFPPAELDVVDTIVRMFTEPVLDLDTAMLAQLWESENTRKAEGNALLGVDGGELRSSDTFCALLEAEGIEIEYKDGKNGPIPAIAKNDPFMRDFLREHDNERVRALAEARLAEKSTLLQTRAATLGWVASRGSAPVYLFYSGAGTLRPSGGDGCNWLNFKRGSPIRRAIRAPAGHYLAPVDASQIECRVLHYLAGGADDPVIQKFRNNEDPYVDLASHFYQEQIYKPEKDDPRKAEMEAKRGMGKQGRLMCLGPNTEVLTNNGVKPIVLVTLQDKLWDGDQWVTHQGLIYQGEQNVVEIKGVKVTSDHLILCGPQVWSPAACLQNESIQSRALGVGMANLPLSVSKSVRKAGFLKWLFDARAERLNIPLIRRIYLLVVQLAAQNALVKRLVFGLKNTTGTLTCVLTRSTALASWGASPRYMGAATNKQNTRTMPIMAVEASRFTDHGSEIVALSSHIWSRCRDGIIQNFRLTALKITRAIAPAICDLLQRNSKRQIDDACGISSRKSPTYDLSFAGPRNRFMIFSDAGPLIVHNCGYGASGKQFKATAASGQYGPRVDMTIEEADSFVALYRRENQPVTARGTGYWALCERMLARLAGGDPIDYGPLHVRDHRIYIQGAPMIYDTIEYHTPAPDEENGKTGWRVKKRDGWRFIWGSKLTQNICEGVSRMIVSQAMTRIKKKYGIRTLNWPYDELLLLIPKNGREEEMLELCKAEMVAEPSWLPGLPLACDGSLGSRYEK